MYEVEIQRFLERHNYISVQPKAALIDMDGTLYDSMPLHTRAWHQMATEEGLTTQRDEFYLYEGRTGASTINLLTNREWGRDATDDEIRRMYARKAELFNSMEAPPVMPGAQKLIEFLTVIGVKCVLVTGSGQHSLIDRLERDFPGVFSREQMVTSADVKYGKPHPEPYLKAAERVHLHPNQCIAIENAPLGVESADRAGVFTIGVTTGPIPATAMEDAGAAVVYPSMIDAMTNIPVLIYSLITNSNNFN